jgi:hypothetical protein
MKNLRMSDLWSSDLSINLEMKKAGAFGRLRLLR